ncbi:Mitochondrial Rho GTPase 1 [Hibiscus syriacus]|uniref:Mitochondrial Rho GTPase 1 n=1 Tax=Hibiscus syriacus TaxID=106335 RepID=A0A6A3BVT2_HIBSY|nr:Mitochondrial Rho GTPase 1 [Hibiscus syriacus]
MYSIMLKKAVLHPTAPLFDQEKQNLKPRCIRALKRIFMLCDHDMDGALSDAELNEFLGILFSFVFFLNHNYFSPKNLEGLTCCTIYKQVKCFNVPLQPAEIVGVKRVVQERIRGGVSDLGLTLEGFLFLHALFIEKGRLETTWAVLRKFGYNDELKLRDDTLPVPTKHAPDQNVELTNEAIDFLRGIFRLYDSDNDGSLQPSEFDDIFVTAPESPWTAEPYIDAAERTAQGNLTLNGFLSEWALMTSLEPALSLANLICIGYGGDPTSALRITRRRSVDRKKKQTQKNVFHCFVFGPKKSGKSTLLNSIIGRSFSSNYTPTNDVRYVANVVEQIGKTLILQEIPEDGVKQLLSNKECLAACDVAVFLYDSSDEYSWKRSRELLLDVARRGEDSGYGVPCLLVAAKDDLDPFPMSLQNSTRVTQQLGMEAPIPVGVKLRDSKSVLSRILSAAEHPHLSIPETEKGKKRKRYRRLVNSSLMFVSG